MDLKHFQKPRTTWIEVSRSALTNNVKALRAQLAPGTLFMAVVKANAYGHGAAESARVIQDAGADRFAVATLAEAIEVREAGIARPILVLGYTPPLHAMDALGHNIALTVVDLATAEAMNSVVGSSGKRLMLHMKVNTGMNRLGLRPEAVARALATLRDLPHVAVEGLFTHFATADETDRGFAEIQLAEFRSLLAQLKEIGLRPHLAHAANSAALLTMPHTHLDMVRSGIAIYGLDPDMDQCPLPPGFRPVLSWKAIVTQVTALAPGEGVSYGREFIADKPMRVAAVPVGYADGFPRKPSNWGSVLIRGCAAPILGRVCMDQTVVDVTEIEAATGTVEPGEEVVLIGRQGRHLLSAETISERVGTNNYDVVSRILSRVPRLYTDE